MVKEDELSLYGFATETERSTFEHLIEVNGVGAKLALKILSTFPPARVATAISEGDVDTIQQVKGVGRRTAEVIVATLRKALVHLAGEPGDRGDMSQADAILALVRLGYSRKQAESAAEKACAAVGSGATLTEIISQALRDLS